MGFRKEGSTLGRRFYQTGEFARRAGVTVRTLRYYDRLGLLRPSARTPAGHRLYTDDDLVALQRVLALRFLGISLDEVRGLTGGAPADAVRSLRLQKELMLEKRRLLDRVVEAVDHAIVAFNRPGEPDWDYLLKAIRVIQLERQQWKEFYSESARKKIEEFHKDYTMDDARRDAGRWQAVLDAFKDACRRGLDPASPEVQVLVEKYLGLINEFTRGDQEIAEGLRKMYSSPDSPYPSPFTAEEHEYVQHAVDIGKRAGRQAGKE